MICTVDRDDLAGAHQNCVPDRDLVDRHIFESIALLAVRETRRAIDERLQIAFGAPDGKIFQQIAAGIHDGDNHPRQCFAKRERR